MPASSAPIVVRLDLEWRHIRTRREELAQVRRWGLPGPGVRSLDEVLARCGYRFQHVECAQPQSTNWMLLRLVELARFESLAARIVLQRILPALCAVARRNSNGKDTFHRVLDELVANAWTVIVTYPVERRPHHVASNLVRDIGFVTTVRPRRRTIVEEPKPPFVLDRPADDRREPLDELVALLLDARADGRLSDEDLGLLAALVSYGRPENLAAALNVTPRTVRNHRDRIVRQLQRYVAA